MIAKKIGAKVTKLSDTIPLNNTDESFECKNLNLLEKRTAPSQQCSFLSRPPLRPRLLVNLPILESRHGPCKVLRDIFPYLRERRIDLDKGIRFKVCGVGDLLGNFLSADDEVPRDGVIVILTRDDERSEGILASTFESVEETTNEVGGHEDESELIVIFIIHLPDGPAHGVKVLPEPVHSFRNGVVVGVEPLPLVENEGPR